MVQSNTSTAACEAIQLYKEARALLVCHVLSKNHKTKKAAKLLQSTEDKQKCSNMPCKLPSVPLALQIRFSTPTECPVH